MASKVTGVRLKAGERLRLETPGGGGWGDPWRRDPDAVARDVRRGFVSVEKAAADYGVAVAADGAIDVAQTAALRAGRPA